MREVVYISFYSDVYKAGADRLKEQLTALGIHHDIVHVKKKGWDWQRYVRYKPTFILERMKAHPEADAVVWVDSDACVWAKSPAFWETDAELGVFFAPIPTKGVFELLSGTMYWRNTGKVRKAVQTWITAMKGASKTLKKPEQQILHAILPKLNLKLLQLDREDCMISGVVDLEYQRCRGVRISHCQWSRTFRQDNQTPRSVPSATPRPRRSRSRKRRKPNPIGAAEPFAPEPSRTLQDGKDRIVARRSQLSRDGTAERARDRRDKIKMRRARKERLKKKAKEAANSQVPPGPTIPVPEIPEVAYKPIGGLTRGPQATKDQIARAHDAMKKLARASELDGECSDASAVVIMGNSWSLWTHDLDPINTLPVVSCNRILRPREGEKQPVFTPNYICFGDREAYCQERDSGRLKRFAKGGGRVLVSDSIFDPMIAHGPRKSGNDYAMAQPPPPFKAYLFDYGPKNKKGWNYKTHVAQDLVELPINLDTLGKFIVTGQNISGTLLQVAAILGAKVIGCLGIELAWPTDGPSHHCGDGQAFGAWDQKGSLGAILGSHKQIKRRMKMRGIKVCNLSPVRNTPFASVWGHYDYNQFVQKFCG